MAATIRGRAKAKASRVQTERRKITAFFSNCQIWHGKKSKLQIKTLIAL